MNPEGKDGADLLDSAEMRKVAQRLRDIHVQKSGADWTKSRSLTEEEWGEVKESIARFSFPCVLIATALGFVLVVYDHAPIPGTNLDQLVWIEDREFPFPSCNEGFGGQAETLRILKPITHRSRNAEILSWYGFEPLSQDIEDYRY